jgi:hypothetical protein
MGYRVERLQAGIYIFLYTLLASMPFLFLLLNLDFFLMTFKYDISYFLNLKYLGYF